MSGVRSLRRGATLVGNASATSAPIFVDSDDNKVKVVPAGTGSTEVALADAVNGLQANASTNLILRTALLSNSVRLNSITDSTTTSGDLIGFQSKPRSGVSGTQSVYGGQISASVSDAVALSSSGSVIGLHADVYVRGTSAGTIAGDVRGMQIELTTDDAGTRDITGYVTGLRIRKAFSAGTVTGKQSAIRIEKPEVQTNSENYDGAFEFTGAGSDMWSDDPTTELNLPGGTVKGYIKVIVNNAARYIALYEKGNLAD